MTEVKTYKVLNGESYPLGATVLEGGVNFSIFSHQATGVELLLFERFDDAEPFQIIPHHPHLNKTFSYWHVFVEGIGGGQIYGYRIDGRYDPEQGDRFNRKKVLVDPYARGVVYGKNWSRKEAQGPDDNCRSSMKSLVVNSDPFDWEGVRSPGYHLADSIIYEMHVRGFTQHSSSGVRTPGTFDGMIEKIEYLKELGVTTVELLPVQQFDTLESNFVNPETGEKLGNFWGYNPVNFFAPHRGYYTSDWEKMEYLTGFRDMVKAFHKAGLEVILDVVFNHTGEGGESGPTISLKGFGNSAYYLLDTNKARYSDYSGCGNTVSCNHPVVRRLILDCLRYWVNVMRVDGFRFDLASVLSRDEKGRPMENPPLLWEIEADPSLQKTKIIAEAWDAAGLYQVGCFPGERWAEWNGRFRDDVRKFFRGDNGMVSAFASCITGSGDLYQQMERGPYQSINFVTCHDGFTLNDLVTYNTKHNLANGEQGRDGQNENFSSNYGAEGPDVGPDIEFIRRKQIKNFLATMLLSLGTPMILAGDEFRRTQNGNNNAYCQDNKISWLNWHLVEKHRDLFRFCKEMIRFRKSQPGLRRQEYFFGARNENDWPEISWHGVKPNQPDWGNDSHSIACTLAGFAGQPDIHVIFNAYWNSLQFEIPPPPAGKSWFRKIDTALQSPEDIQEAGQEIQMQILTYLVEARSVVVFLSKRVS